MGLLPEKALHDKPDFPDDTIDFMLVTEYKVELFKQALRILKNFLPIIC
jgi:hypothetical protein